jgi:hypothetical protein
MNTLQALGTRTAVIGSCFPILRVGIGAASLALGLVLSSAAASADPLRITAGALGSGGDDTGFWAVGPGFNLATGAMANRADPVVACDPCTPGTMLNLSSTVTILDWGPGFAELNEQTWPEVYYGGSLSFSAGSVIVPDVPPQPDGLDETIAVPVSTSFTFTGTLVGFADPSLTGTPLFTSQFTGAGRAVGGFGNLGSGVFLDYADYTFDAAAPVPEPGSLLLFASGGAWLAARRRRRFASTSPAARAERNPPRWRRGRRP